MKIQESNLSLTLPFFGFPLQGRGFGLALRKGIDEGG